MTTTPPTPRRGRPPAGKPKHPAINTTVPPDVAAWLASIADGSASRGIRLIVVDAFTKAQKKKKAGAKTH
jgi:hypothetical protein